MVAVKHLSKAELEAGLANIRQAPHDNGVLEQIVRRPDTGEREIVPVAQLDLVEGLVGDSWLARAKEKSPDGPIDLDMQLTVMNSRLIALLAQEKARWPLAGDQLFVDLDISMANLPPGTRLAIGHAVIEVTAPPHTGCKKFASRFGLEALEFISTPQGKGLRLRGLNARVVQAGEIRAGDAVRKL